VHSVGYFYYGIYICNKLSEDIPIFNVCMMGSYYLTEQNNSLLYHLLMCERMIHHRIILQFVPLGQARTTGSFSCAFNNVPLLVRSIRFLGVGGWRQHYLFAQIPHHGSTARYIIILRTTLRWYGVTVLAVASVPSWNTKFQCHGS
jgi:hypothetical protein